MGSDRLSYTLRTRSTLKNLSLDNAPDSRLNTRSAKGVPLDPRKLLPAVSKCTFCASLRQLHGSFGLDNSSGS